MEHIVIPLGERHGPHNWEFADATDRAAAVPITEEIGCVALQLDTNELWRLTAVSPSAVWARINAGRAEPTQDRIALTANGSMSGHLGVATDAGGEVVRASSDTAAQALRFAGVSVNAAVDGDPVEVVRFGPIEHVGWTWTPDQPVFLGINGALVQAVPGGATFVLVVGQALSATRLMVAPQQPIVL
jgi:hypothetical protein